MTLGKHADWLGCESFVTGFKKALPDGKKDGCAPPIESFVESVTHGYDRNRPTTQTASLIAASFRT